MPSLLCSHGYVLAEMGVHQARAHFLKTLGSLVDRPEVGQGLTKTYWKVPLVSWMDQIVLGRLLLVDPPFVPFSRETRLPIWVWWRN